MTIKTVNGALSTAQSSSVIEPDQLSGWKTVLLLITLGVIGVVFHASLRIPLHLPGHHGLEWMALLALSRAMVPRRWAAMGVGMAASAFALLTMWGWHDPASPLIFAASAVLFDALCALLPRQRFHKTLSAICAGLAFSVAGLITFYIGPHGLSAHAAWYLWSFSHFGFGLLGALVGIYLGSLARSRFAT